MLNRRLIVLFVAFTLAFCALGLRLFKLQVVDADKWQEVVRELVHRTAPLETYRGAIRDRNLRIMAQDVPSDELAIDYRAMNCDDKWLNEEAKARMVATGEWDRITDRTARLRRRDEIKAELAVKIDAIPEAISKACQVPREEVLERMHEIRSKIVALKQDMWSRKKFDRDAAQNAAAGNDAPSRTDDDTNLDAEFREIHLKEEVIAHTIRTNIPPEVAHYFRQNAAEFPGLIVRDMSNRRDYPFGEATAHITGTLRYVDKETQGQDRFDFPEMEKSAAGNAAAATDHGNLHGYLPGDRMGEGGVERLAEADLRRAAQRLIDLTDTRDDSDGEVGRIDPVPGRDVQLTVDAALQSDLYNALHDNGGRLLIGKDGKEHFAAIAILSMDGQVMALVSYPSYDPNRIDDTRVELSKDAWRNPLRNRAFRQIYSPGSTVKPLLAAAALAEKVIDPDEEIRCIGHFFPNRSDIFRCDAEAGHGPMTLVPAIAQSCNVYFYTVGQRLGLERLSLWYGRYGFGRETGMELAEEPGHLPKPTAGDADTARSESLFLGIGQGTIDVTPLQMANAYATLLRGGTIIQPRLLANTLPQQSQAFTLSPGILSTVREGMQRCVSTGTARTSFKGFDISVAGKTGTAERRRAVFDDAGNPVEDPGRPLLNPDRTPKLKPDGTPAYAQMMDIGTDAWFVGYAPAGNPRYVVAAVMEWGGHGGAYAAPMVREAFRQLQLHGYLGGGGLPGNAVGIGPGGSRTMTLADSRVYTPTSLKALKDILYRVLTTRVAWPILITIGLLCTASMLALELSSPARADKQRIWLLIGGGVILLALLPHFHILGRVAYALYALAIALLVGVFFAPEVQYTHRWYMLPGDIQFQPSELAKIGFVLSLAWYLRYRKSVRTLNGLIVPFALATVPFALILREPDLGTALLFPLVLYAMLIAAGARLRHLLAIALVAAFIVPGSYPFLRPYQQQRVISFAKQVLGQDDPSHRAGAGYQQYQSKAAIGSGGTTGKGTEAAQHFRQGILPEAYTDFVFAVVGAQWGLAGCLLILMMYLAFYVAAVEIAASTRDNFGRLMVVGLASMILFQATINMYMTVGLGPVAGIALPFVSYGGSSLLASMLAAGLLLNVSVRRNFHSAAN